MGTKDNTYNNNNNGIGATTKTSHPTNATKTAGSTATTKPKEKRRNNEKRKEKSRDAARCRRSRETEIFSELAQVLPLKKDDVNQLDKASIMRVAIAYLKIREMLQLFPKIQALSAELNSESDDENSKNSMEEDESSMNGEAQWDLLKCPESGQLLKQTLDGFLLVLSNDGDITYVSENVCEYLGITKIDILGQSVWEYVHQCDHAELKEALNIKRSGADKIKDEHIQDEGLSTYNRDLFVRFKCTLTSRGRSINIKSASYKVIHLTGHLVTNAKGDEVFVAIGSPIPHPSNIEIPLGTTTFLTKHSLDMKFTYADEKMSNLLNYKPEDLLDQSLYDYHHGSDSECLLKTFKSVLTKGQGETSRYRFLGKYGGYCWVVTQATIVYEKLKPQSVVCVNYIVSQLECKNEIYSLQQHEAANNKQNIDEKECNQNKINEASNKANGKLQTSNIALNESEQTSDIIPEKELKQTFDTLNLNQNNINSTDKQACKVEELATTASSIEEISCRDSQKHVHVKNENLVATATKTPISTATNIVYKPINNAEQQQEVAEANLIKAKIVEEKRPKSVTASVFRVAPINLQKQQQQHHQSLLTTLPNNNNNTDNGDKCATNKTATTTTTKSIITNVLPSSATPLPLRAQSVTASVLTPITQFTNKNLTNINRPLTTTTTTAAILAQKQQLRHTKPPTLPQQQQQQTMSKEFLSFAEDATESTMLKEEPDDLSHVDTCLPLDEAAPLFSEMFVGLMGTYGTLLSDEINSLDSTSSSNADATAQQQQNNRNNENNNTTPSNYNNLNNHNNNSENNRIIDPFYLYREDSNDTNCSQHLLSPSVTSKSPEGSSLPSLCSPTSLSQDADFGLMTINELNMRAPYIPMDEGDDLPLITDDLMWCANGAYTTDELNLNKDPDTLLKLSMHHQQQQPHNQQQQHTYYANIQSEQQQHFSNSLCSSPASTISSLSPASPLQHTQQQHQMNSNVFCSDSSELAALLCGTGNGTLSILNNNNNNNNHNNNNNNSNNNSSGNGNNSGNSNVNSYDADDDNNLVGGIVNNIGDIAQHSPLAQQTTTDTEVSYKAQLLQQFQQQGESIAFNINCKKEKFVDSPITANSLCDAIEDEFDNVYNKDSNNSYCWSEFLQINVSDSNAATATAAIGDVQLENACKQQLQLTEHQQRQEQQQQNVIINAVPLITIQNTNKNLLLEQVQQQQQQNDNAKILITDELLLTTATANDLLKCNNNTNNNNNNGSNGNMSNGKISSIKLVNGTTAAIAPITTKATIRLIENKMPAQQQQLITPKQLAQHSKGVQLAAAAQAHGNKRHLSAVSGATTQVDAKRLKCNEMVTQKTTATPQLLKQLMNGNLQQLQQQEQLQHENKQRKISNHTTAMFSINTNNQQPQQQQQQQQSSTNSVLKNLLISGCDDLPQPAEPMLVDESPLEPLAITIPLALDIPLAPPTCVTESIIKPWNDVGDVAKTVLRDNNHNPMIGGANVLLSPPFINLTNDDSNPPGLAALDHSDSASDSGIDDISMSDAMSPMKQYTNEPEQQTNNFKSFKELANKQLIAAQPAQQPTVTTQHLLTTVAATSKAIKINEQQKETGKTSRKSSISFMDSSNPFGTPLLMQLCDDDYQLNTREILADNVLEHVLGNWSH